MLKLGLPLQRKVITRMGKNKAAMESLLNFAMQPDVTSVLSFGSKRVVSDGVENVMAARNRVDSIARLWKRYDALMIATNVKDRVQRSTFYVAMQALTSRDLKVRSSSSSYCTSCL